MVEKKNGVTLGPKWATEQGMFPFVVGLDFYREPSKEVQEGGCTFLL